jgi:cytochrome P450
MMDRSTLTNWSDLRTLGVADTLTVLGDVVLPTFSKGILIRRPMAMAWAERGDWDRRAVLCLQAMRSRLGTGPLLLRTPWRPVAFVLAPEHAARVLDGDPEPFAPAETLKYTALAHFEPQVSLLSRGPERAERRRFNDEVLDSACPVHRLADRFMTILDEEIESALARAGATLQWAEFATAWNRMVRRIVLGDAARNDEELTLLLTKLRAAANWAFLHPGRPALREEFYRRLARYLARGEAGSLAARAATMPKGANAAEADQVTHWLFAFDAGAIATFQALALLASHPQQQKRARAEISAVDVPGRKTLPFLRACVLDSLRLWPTTPAILRETTQDTDWGRRIIRKNTTICLFTPFFHRDEETLPQAHRFAPEVWLGETGVDRPPVIPFSAGPGQCPARHLVLMLASALLAAILPRNPRLQQSGRLSADLPLPGTLNPYALCFTIEPPGT